MCSVPEWGNGARIICVTDLDTKMKRNRCGEFVALVDRELGYADIPTKPQSIVSSSHHFIRTSCLICVRVFFDIVVLDLPGDQQAPSDRRLCG